MTRRTSCTSLIAAAALAAVASACGGSSGTGTSAADFVRRVTTEFSRGQSGRLWNELVPADQRVVTRARFVECQANEGWDLRSIKVLDTYRDPVAVGARTFRATAVSVRVVSDNGVTTATMHAVSVGGAWHWLLQPSDRSAYSAGRCPRTG
jgi:hypothetical protein